MFIIFFTMNYLKRNVSGENKRAHCSGKGDVRDFTA